MLRPSSFFQNDLWVRDALLEYGVYPFPLGSKGVSRVDVRDIGLAAANALTGDGHAGRTYTLVGPDALTGPDCARIWGEALGKEIAYGGDDLDAWEEQARGMMPAWLTYDLRLMYELFHTKGLAATDAQLEETRHILGGEPRSFRSFAEETAAQWS